MGRAAVCLLLILLGTAAPKPSTHRQGLLLVRLRQLMDIVGQLQKSVEDLEPELAPAPEDVKKHCERAAFSCFQSAGLQPVQAGGAEARVTRLVKQLKRKLPPSRPKAGEQQTHRPTCPPCDSYEKQPLEEFLQRLKALLQRMIGQHLS